MKSPGVMTPNQIETDVLLMMKMVAWMKMIVTKDEEYAGQHPDLNGSQALRLHNAH